MYLVDNRDVNTCPLRRKFNSPGLSDEFRKEISSKDRYFLSDIASSFYPDDLPFFPPPETSLNISYVEGNDLMWCIGLSGAVNRAHSMISNVWNSRLSKMHLLSLCPNAICWHNQTTISERMS